MTNEQLFNQIHSLANPSLISKKLKEYPREFADDYRKYFHKLRVAKSRELNKDKINEARREARRLISKSTVKPIQHIDKPIDIDAVDTDVKREYKAGAKITKLNENTIDNYIKSIRAIYPKYNNDKPLNDDAEILKMLNGVKYNSTKLYKQNKYIIDNVKDIATNYPSYLPKLYSIYSRLNGKNLKQLRESLYPYMTAYNANYTENRSNVVVNKEMTSKISFNTADVIENANKIDDAYDKLMYMLLFLMPTRRLYDYRIMRIATKKGDTDDMEFNWYYQGKMYINNTKNKQKMILEAPNEIIGVINQLPADTDYIFGKLYTAPTLSRRFATITNDIYGDPFNAVDIRKLRATYNLKTAGDTGDMRKYNETAKKMGHSTAENANYSLKIDSLSYF
jgi:hypothetical protein